MKEVTDPALLSQLEGKEVTDPSILGQLEGTSAMQTAAPTLSSEAPSLDIVGRAKQWLTAEPEDPRRSTLFDWEPTWPGQAIRAAGRFLMPGSRGEAAATGAAMVAMPGVGAVAPRLAARLGLGATGAKMIGAGGRVAAGAGAGATGALVDEGDVGTGAAIGGGITAALETAAPLVGKVLRSLPTMKGRIAATDASRIGQAIEDIVPELRGARSAADLQNLGRVSSAGKSNLSGLFQDVEAGIGHIPITVPSISTAPIPVSEALKELGKMGAAGYAPNWSRIDPMVRTTVGMDARALRAQTLDEIRGEIGKISPDYLAAYDQAREMYLKGLGLLKMVKPGGVYREYPGRQPQLHTPAVQQYVSEHRGELMQRLGARDFQRLVDAVYRGGEIGTKDIVTPGAGGPLDAIQSWMRGQNTGATQALRLPIATVLPNVGSQYTGRTPYAPSEGLKMILDILGIAAAPRVVGP